MTEHYYTPLPTSKEKPRQFETVLRGQKFVFHTSSGMFSPDRIDTGTRVLIENAFVKPGWRILDLGCGYGAVGIAIAKTANTNVTLTDTNSRAVRYAKMNAAANHVAVTTHVSEGFASAGNLPFDAILFNPPQTAGMKVCEQLILQAVEHLTPGGTLQVVARHNKGGARMEKFMHAMYGNVATLAKKSGYRVYQSVKPQ
ncbi:class I SAM-dependent methyltransferase [Candidatus Woesearchaeota archaeon]|nr:class I SAM-dependent methyltransferase [Candidatus Woesearchaeota archaeon]